jgi:competence protein ComFC
MTAQVQEKIIDFFFPRRCIGCGKLGGLICIDCTKKLPRLLAPFCQKCGKPESSGVFCPACWGQKNEIDGIRSVFRFEGTIRRAIHELKYRRIKSIAEPLAALMAKYLLENEVPGNLFVPVPLHSKRLRERGYNQSVLLAQKLGKLTARPVIEGVLFRQKDSLPQARTSTVEERRMNVDNAFRCRGVSLRENNVVLIDDVCTSGATLESCARALKAAGTQSVWGFTLAREI